MLPRASFETEGHDYVPVPRLQNRQYAFKVMYMGIVDNFIRGG